MIRIAHILNIYWVNHFMNTHWPVCLHSATYEQVINLLEACLDDSWTEEERADLYGNNAIRFYRLRI